MSIAINIKYDTVFGNRNIRGLLSRVKITGTNLPATLDYFSIVVTTFALASIVIVVYSAVMTIPRKLHKSIIDVVSYLGNFVQSVFIRHCALNIYPFIKEV